MFLNTYSCWCSSRSGSGSCIYKTIYENIHYTHYYTHINTHHYTKYTILHINTHHYTIHKITQYYILPPLLTTPLLISSVTTFPADFNNLAASSIDLFCKLSPLIARILSLTCKASVLRNRNENYWTVLVMSN